MITERGNRNRTAERSKSRSKKFFAPAINLEDSSTRFFPDYRWEKRGSPDGEQPVERTSRKSQESWVAAEESKPTTEARRAQSRKNGRRQTWQRRCRTVK